MGGTPKNLFEQMVQKQAGMPGEEGMVLPEVSCRPAVARSHSVPRQRGKEKMHEALVSTGAWAQRQERDGVGREWGRSSP